MAYIFAMILIDEKLGLFLEFKTYQRNDLNLYDYSSKDIKVINTIIESGTFIVRKKSDIIRKDRQSDIYQKMGEDLLFRIRSNKIDQFTLENPIPMNNIAFTEYNVNNLNNKIWYVLNSNNPNDIIKNGDYNLCENDIIKMGNIKLIARKINIKPKEDEGNKAKLDNIYNISKYDINSLNKGFGSIFNFLPSQNKYFIDENYENECYICQKRKCSKENPIIGFCECNYVHYECLKQKFKEKEIIHDRKNVKNYLFNACNCKKCNFVYPLRFKIDELGKSFQLDDIDEPKVGDYIILESIEYKTYFNYIKSVHVVQLDREISTLGRSMSNNIIIRDPSISKFHAELKYDLENKKITIINKSKKFRTSILVKKPLVINDKEIQIQIGRTLIEAKIMKIGQFEKIVNEFTQRPLPKKE